MRAKTGTRQHTLTYAAHAPPGTSAEHRACFTPKRSLVRTQYRPQISHLVRGLSGESIRTSCRLRAESGGTNARPLGLVVHHIGRPDACREQPSGPRRKVSSAVSPSSITPSPAARSTNPATASRLSWSNPPTTQRDHDPLAGRQRSPHPPATTTWPRQVYSPRQRGTTTLSSLPKQIAEKSTLQSQWRRPRGRTLAGLIRG